MKARKIKWLPAVPVKKPDSIMSSEFTNATSGPFVPSYEKEEVNMFDLLSMHYAKVWLSERTIEKQIALSTQDNDFLVRRYVIRGLLVRRKEQEQEKRFIMKKFRNVPSKIMIRTSEEIDQLKSKLSEQEKRDLDKEARESVTALGNEGVPTDERTNIPPNVDRSTAQSLNKNVTQNEDRSMT